MINASMSLSTGSLLCKSADIYYEGAVVFEPRMAGGSIAAYGYDSVLVVSQVVALGGYKQGKSREDSYKRNLKSKGAGFSQLIEDEKARLGEEINISNFTYGPNGLARPSVVKMRSY